ncbi:MAG: prepilin peptidase [Elainellaceae cyanobacterium]
MSAHHQRGEAKAIAILISALAFLLGIAVGSFLNVVVYRLPRGQSILWPPSRCPHCGQQLSWRDNVPVAGWLLLRGQCRYCSGPISVRYPLVEFSTGLLFLLAVWRFPQAIPMVGYCALISWLLALSLIDLDTMRLPNALTQPGLVAGLAFHSALGWQTAGPAGLAYQLVMSILAAVIGIWLFEGIAFAGSLVYGQTAMGGGDAKLAAMLGAWLGWQQMLLASFLACGLGALLGAVGIASGQLSRRQAMPFGPFLALGGVLSLFVGRLLIVTYLGWFS